MEFPLGMYERGWRDAIKAAVNECEEWAIVNKKLGNKEQAFAYANAVLAIRGLETDITTEPKQ